MNTTNEELIPAVLATISATEEDTVVSTPTRAQRSAANKRLYAQIQGQKGNITRAAKAGDKVAFMAAVQEADTLCPANWTTEREKIKAKAVDQRKVLNAALAAV